MKVVAITGVFDRPIVERLWEHLEHACREVLPIEEFVVVSRRYWPWQRTRIAAFAEEIVATHNVEGELLLIGVSFGGVIACAIAPRLTRSTLRAVITINSPHKIALFYRYLHTHASKLSVPVITFGSLFDFTVPAFLTRYPGSTHSLLWSDHIYTLIFSRRPAYIIAQKIKTTLGF